MVNRTFYNNAADCDKGTKTVIGFRHFDVNVEFNFYIPSI